MSSDIRQYHVVRISIVIYPKWFTWQSDSASNGPEIQASTCIISKAKRIYIIKMVIDVSMVTYNKIRSRDNSLSVRARAYSSIMVNPLVIKGNTRNTIVYNISVINCSCKRSIYCLEIDSKLLRVRLITLTIIVKKR